MWACGALYLASLAVDPGGIESGGLLRLVSPSGDALFLLGASGWIPVFGYGRWWTPLSASWLHGGVLHIVFNMLWVRDLGPAVVHLYGVGRTLILWTVAGAYLPFLPGVLRGAGLTVGASASVFGLMGALFHYGRRGGSAHLRQTALRWILGGLAFGLFIPRVDNWAHLGGLAAGYLVSLWMDPLTPERGTHLVWGLACLLATAAAVLASVLGGPAG
jgi:rhomboid protease GluP